MSSSLLVELSSLGITLALVDGQLHARPRQLLTPELRERIALHRDDLIAALGEPAPLPPLDNEIVIRFAAKHTATDIDRRIDRLTTQAAHPNATPLDIVVLADWRQIRSGKQGNGP